MVRYPARVASDPTGKGDELARTATAPVGSSSHVEPADPTAPIGATVGRYRLERELGEGGMGVVHAAFDPDLQRRVALKVLRIAAPSADAKDRLLREARAMARLAHPNVVTVHEVGTANGRDYVAMELILGETLADWLRSGKRRAADIVAAFLAAGRGLAAAHAAGIVHRDFKPHNVLRSRHGRIVVTDFGLAREAQADLPAHEAALPLSARMVTFAASTPSSLSGITMTGSLLGTPAYMAPEQWEGGLVTPATDQFAFCVALWEALAGARPYRGPTLEELRAQAALGPGALDASKIPRRLRQILRRGLDPDPMERWPTMDALLARLVRAERRPGIAVAIAAGALVAASVLILAMRAGGELAAGPRCEPSLLEPGQVWSADARAALGPQPAAVHAIDAELAAWRTARATACSATPATRAPRLACLDGVLARIDAVARATRTHRDGAQVDAGALLIDPRVCELSRAPRLMTNTSPELRDAMATWLARSATAVPLRADAVTALVARTAVDPCASSLAHLLAADVIKTAADKSRHLDEAQQDAERCGDDRMLAETAIAQARAMMDNEFLSATVTTKLRLADAAVHRIEQRDLKAEIDLMKVEVAKRNERIDDAIKYGTDAMDGFAARGRLRAQLRAGLLVLGLRQTRATPDDLVAVPDTLARWRARATAELGDGDEIVRAIDSRLAEWAWLRGDVARADAELERVRRPLPNDRTKRIAGIVVDPRGKPVAGATVSAAWSLRGDSIHAAASLTNPETMRVTTTAADGRFELPDAIEDAIVIAELGDRRSLPMIGGEDVRLALAPTSRLEGRVDLAGQAPTNVVIVVRDSSLAVPWRYSVAAPVAADGSFAIDGIPRHDVRVFAAIDGLTGQSRGGTSIFPRVPVVRGLSLSLAKSTRVVHVLVRNTVNTKLANAEIVVLPGKVPSMNALAINQQFRGGSVRNARQLEGEHAPKQVVGAARPGDLFATVTDVPEGIASACALGLPEISDAEVERKLMAHLDKIQVVCTVIPEHGDVVTIEVPPMPRFD
jgi:predicted Ser/Thr protein kinase